MEFTQQNVQMLLPEGGATNLQFPIPNRCPLCHHNVLPIVQQQAVKVSVDEAELPLRCPRIQCNRTFICRYKLGEPQAHDVRLYQLEAVVPRSAEAIGFPDPVKKVSPMFVRIYGQAMEAESHE